MIDKKAMLPYERIGPVSRIVFAILSLFAPRVLLLSTIKAFLAHVGELDKDTLRMLIQEIQDV